MQNKKVDKKPKKKINSRAKGASGERELANYLKAQGFNARRGQQFSGSPDSPDIVHDIGNWHIECKRVEALQLYPAMDQAKRDMPKGHKPVVVHRKNEQEWVVIIRLADWLELVAKAPQKPKPRFEAEQDTLDLEQKGTFPGLLPQKGHLPTTPTPKKAAKRPTAAELKAFWG